MHLLMQIITRLTTVNNQVMLGSIELIQQKHMLKQEVTSFLWRICVLTYSWICCRESFSKKFRLIGLAIYPISLNLWCKSSFTPLADNLWLLMRSGSSKSRKLITGGRNIWYVWVYHRKLQIKHIYLLMLTVRQK